MPSKPLFPSIGLNRRPGCNADTPRTWAPRCGLHLHPHTSEASTPSLPHPQPPQPTLAAHRRMPRPRMPPPPRPRPRPPMAACAAAPLAASGTSDLGLRTVSSTDRIRHAASVAACTEHGEEARERVRRIRACGGLCKQCRTLEPVLKTTTYLDGVDLDQGGLPHERVVGVAHAARVDVHAVALRRAKQQTSRNPD